MSEDNGGSKLAFFLAGCGIGAILALLFTPKSGKETRDYIAARAEEGKDYLSVKGKELRKQAEEYVEKGLDKSRDLVGKSKERLSAVLDAGEAAIEAGKKVYQEEKSKTR